MKKAIFHAVKIFAKMYNTQCCKKVKTIETDKIACEFYVVSIHFRNSGAFCLLTSNVSGVSMVNLI